MAIRISELTDAGALTGTELLEVSRLSATVTKTATTISAQASDNSINDSGAGFVTAGFAVGDSVRVQGFTGNVANNIVSGRITALTAGKMTIGGADGDVLVDDAAGESVTITKWETMRAAFLPPQAGNVGNALVTDGASVSWGLATSSSAQIFQYTFSATTTPPPSGGQVRYNNATQLSATQIYVSKDSASAIVDLSNYYRKIVPNTIFWVQARSDATQYHRWLITAVAESAGYFIWTVTLMDSHGAAFGGGNSIVIGYVFAGAAGGAVATDPIFDTKGDLPVGTGPDTAARLVAGTAGQVLTVDSVTATGLKWATPAPATTPTDPYFANVVLLLHGDGANGGTTFTDSSPKARSPSLVSGCITTTTAPNFGTACIDCTTSGGNIEYGSSTDFSFVLVFTYEFWVKTENSGFSNYVMAHSVSRYMQCNSTGTQIGPAVGWGSAQYFTGLVPGVWAHCAITRDAGGLIRTFVNGVLMVSAVSYGSTDLTAVPLGIMGVPGRSDLKSFTGQLDDIRITIGVARYTANFTPPTQSFSDSGTPTITTIANDPFWDTKGDLAAGTGADTASKLAVGTNGQVLTADSAQATGVKWAVVAGSPTTALSIAAGVVNIDCSLGDYYTLALSADVTGFTFSNLPGAGKGFSKWVHITQNASAAKAVTLTQFKWAGGIGATAVSTTLSAIDVLSLTSVDNGTTVRATLAKAYA